MNKQALSDELNGIGTSLTGGFAVIDANFLSVGDRLSAALGIFADITQNFDDLAHGLVTERIEQAARNLRHVAQEVGAMGQALAEERQGLAAIISRNREVGAKVAQLRETVRIISILAVNSQIAAAGIGDQGSDFLIFTGEIARLAKTAEKTIEVYSKEYKGLDGLLRAASDAQLRFDHENQDSLLAVAHALDVCLSEVNARRTKAAAAASEITEYSSAIAKQVGVVVMGLQIGDITRQRIEHVAHAVQVMETALKNTSNHEGGAWYRELTEAEGCAVVASICRLQAAQLDHALSEFDGEIVRMTQSLQRLASDAQKMALIGTAVFGAAGGKHSSFLDDLEEKLAMTASLIHRCAVSRAEIDQVIGSVAQRLNGLLVELDDVRDIEVDMRLVGLNMALKCGRLGTEGQTLRAIAQELRSYAQATVSDAADLTDAVRRVVETAEESSAARMNYRSEKISELEQTLSESLQIFRDSAEVLNTARALMSRNGRDVETMLLRTGEDLTGSSHAGRSFRNMSQRLQRIALEEDTSGVSRDSINARVNAFTQSQYTMASEREIHERFGQTAKASSPIAMSIPAPTLEDMLF